MAQIERLKEERAGKARSKSVTGITNSGSQLVSFNPTDNQKETIKAAEMPLEDVLAFFEVVLQDGHKITVSYQDKYDSYSVIVREGNVEWDKAVSVSTWHRDLVWALRCMHYALTIVWPDFPTAVSKVQQLNLDW